MIIAFCRALSYAIPDAHGAGDVTRRDVVSRGREASYGGVCRVGGVLCADGGIVYRADEDGFTGLLYIVLAL
jgi:hypothetical protein